MTFSITRPRRTKLLFEYVDFCFGGYNGSCFAREAKRSEKVGRLAAANTRHSFTHIPSFEHGLSDPRNVLQGGNWLLCIGGKPKSVGLLTT